MCSPKLCWCNMLHCIFQFPTWPHPCFLASEGSFAQLNLSLIIIIEFISAQLRSVYCYLAFYNSLRKDDWVRWLWTVLCTSFYLFIGKPLKGLLNKRQAVVKRVRVWWPQQVLSFVLLLPSFATTPPHVLYELMETLMPPVYMKFWFAVNLTRSACQMLLLLRWSWNAFLLRTRNDKKNKPSFFFLSFFTATYRRALRGQPQIVPVFTHKEATRGEVGF